jgi:hypothetical protein
MVEHEQQRHGSSAPAAAPQLNVAAAAPQLNVAVERRS